MRKYTVSLPEDVLASFEEVHKQLRKELQFSKAQSLTYILKVACQQMLTSGATFQVLQGGGDAKLTAGPVWKTVEDVVAHFPRMNAFRALRICRGEELAPTVWPENEQEEPRRRAPDPTTPVPAPYPANPE